jgi:chemotaxis protein MotB
VSYADFITLLFAFFTSLYAISVTDTAKAERLVHSIRESFGDSLFELGTEEPSLLDQLRGAPMRTGKDLAATHPDEPRRRLDLLGERVRELPGETGRANGLNVSQTEEGLVISLADTLFFAGGGTSLTAQSGEALRKVAALLAEVPNHVRVEGHTDNEPVTTAKFPSNWHLASARAVEVLLELEKHGIPRGRLSVSGFADQRPLVSNETVEGRLINRRVDLVVLRARLSANDP